MMSDEIKKELSELHTTILLREVRDLLAINNLYREINNSDDVGGYWITTEAGNHLYISDVGEMKTGPSGKTVGYTKESSTGQVIAQAKHGQHMPESSYKRSATSVGSGSNGGKFIVAHDNSFSQGRGQKELPHNPVDKIGFSGYDGKERESAITASGAKLYGTNVRVSAQDPNTQVFTNKRDYRTGWSNIEFRTGGQYTISGINVGKNDERSVTFKIESGTLIPLSMRQNM